MAEKVEGEMEKKVERDVAKTTEAFNKWFAEKMPERQELHVENLEAPQATGFSSETIMFDLVWTEDGAKQVERAVARIKPSGDFQVFPLYDIKLQYEIMRILGEKTDVPVPPMLGYEPDESVIGDEFYCMDFVNGIVPTDQPPYHTAGWVPERSLEERERLWNNGLDAMCQVHNLDYKALGIDFLPRGKDGDSHMETHLKYWDHFFEWGMEGREHPICRRAQKWLWDNRPTDEEDERIIWGDSRLANQIFSEDLECLAVIDWEMARIGSPVEDLGYWIGMDRVFSEGLGVERLEGLPDRDATIARWKEKTGLEPKYLQYYEVWCLYRFSLLMGRIGIGMHIKGILPEESDFEINNFASGLLDKMLKEEL